MSSGCCSFHRLPRGTWPMSCSMAKSRETEKRLASSAEAVAITAMPTVSATPACPNSGSAARASAKSRASTISGTVRFAATATVMSA